MVKKKVLVICIDRDNDLGEKVGITGPVIGREATLEAATKLALADPEEPDSNTMFEAVRTLDRLGPEESGQVVTLTGHRRLGYEADKAISGQLDSVIREYPTDYCIFISDGASDEEILPIIQSRIKINSKRIVVMKQAKELEKTYFVLLEKLKEPYYQRLVFGVPALAILALAASNWSWRPLAIVVGVYLLIKGFGLEERVISSISGFRISVERIGFILYLAAVPLLLISAWFGIQEYVIRSEAGYDVVKITAYTIRGILSPYLFPFAVFMVLAGKVVDLYQEKRKYEIVKYGLYCITTLILWLIFTVASDWVVAEAYFSDFVLVILVSILLSAVSITVMKSIRTNVVGSMKLENKEVLNHIGLYVGKIVGVDKKRGFLVVQTPFGQRINVSLESISDIGDKVLVRY